MSVDIRGLDHSQVLVALYNASGPKGKGNFNPNSERPLSVQEAAALLNLKEGRIDYLRGRPIKVVLNEGTEFLNPREYDLANGEGAMQRVIDSLRMVQ